MGWSARLFRDAYTRRSRAGNVARISKRGQIHQPDAIRELVDELPGDGKRQTRLATAARTGKREQPRLRQEEALLYRA